MSAFSTQALPLVDSAEGYLSLGLMDMAEAEIRKAIEQFGESPATLRIKQQMACTRGDYDAVGQMVRADIEHSSDPSSDLHAISISGDPHWVYARCLNFEQTCQADYHYWYNRACFASRVGKWHDALTSLHQGFCKSSLNHAMAFLDSDLEPLWSWILSMPMDDDIAELLAHAVWNRAIANQAASVAEIVLSPTMKATVPDRFRSYLVPASTILRTSEAMPTSIFREYLDWQKTIAQLRVDALRDAHSRARTYLVGRQLRFALRQIKQGNPTAARYHILHYLAFRPHDFGRLAFMKNLGMGYLMEDIAPAIEEDLHFVHKLESVARPWHSAKCSPEDFEAVGRVGRKTALFQARRAGYEIDTGRVNDGIRRLLGVLRSWPHDSLGYSRLVDAYIQLERWEEARLCLRAAPAHYHRFYRCREQSQQMKEESVEVVDPGPPTCPFLGQRDLGGLLVPQETSKGRKGA